MPDTPLSHTRMPVAFLTELNTAIWVETSKRSRAAERASDFILQKTRNKMVHHKEFETAGKKPGLQVWRVVKLDLELVPPEFYGEFYVGDSYIVLYTRSTCPPDYSIYAWNGEETSKDEKCCAAIFMIQLDDYLGGSPKQQTVYQNEESTDFMSYFKSGIIYKEGGVASGLKQTVTNSDNVKRLLHVKGRRTIRAKEVPLCWSSFNKGDCFIIDLGKNIYHWSGSECSPFEKLKTIQLANEIRDNERKGRAEVKHIDEGSETEEILEALGPKPDLPEAQSEDVAFDTKNERMASLYQISDACGSMTTTLVQDKNPFEQDKLSQEECYILDNGKDKQLFVWKGKNSNMRERDSAYKSAQKFIEDNYYPETTQITILPAGAESMLFKQFFFNWMDKDETTCYGQTYTIGSIAQVEQIPFDASELHNNKKMAAQHCMVDDGSGKVQIWRVENRDKEPVDPSTHGQFFGGDCYLILYSYSTGGREKHIIYTWQGQKCSKDELAASAFLTVNLDDSMGKVATQVRVVQGQEPPHLVSIFKDKPLVIHLGGTCSEHGQSQAASKRLFHIRQSSTKANRAVEVQPTASSLNSNDVFVLKSPKSLFIWRGKGADEGEMGAAQYVASLLGGSATEVEESSEPEDFWEVLGGKNEYQTSPTLKRTLHSPRLFGCSNKTGRLIAEEVPGDFTQLDLAPDDVMLLDTQDQLFIWVGKDANETEKTGSDTIAMEYLESDPSGRSNIPITKIKMGDEPLSFTGWFHAWEPTLWDVDFKDCHNLEKLQNMLAQVHE